MFYISDSHSPLGFPSVFSVTLTRFLFENTVGVLENLSFQAASFIFLFNKVLTLLTSPVNSRVLAQLWGNFRIGSLILLIFL